MTVYRVLIVEDHPFQCRSLAALFESVGHFEVDIAWDGASALQRLAASSFDLLLTDLMMPHMDGIQLIQALAHLPSPPALALMSAASRRMLIGAGQVAKNLGLCVVGLLPKPLGARNLLELRESLNERVEQARTFRTRPTGCRAPQTLASALGNGEIQAWFQPKKALHDGNIVGAEALVRWVHPAEGLLMPRDFLADIEHAELEVQLLTSMLAQTLKAQAQWTRIGHPLPVSINLPTHLLDQEGLIERLLAQVRLSRARPRHITFELTESSTTQQSSNYYAGACRLRMMGFGLAQDDFGKGYSSYFNLVSTPFTELKIDRSLIHGCADNEQQASAVLSIVQLGRELNMVTVAEGVETRAELEVLRRMQCHQVQGFIVSPAVSADEIGTLISVERPRSMLS